MTLSGRTNNTTLNILHGVRRSDLPLLPPPPSLSVRWPVFLCPLPLGATSYSAPNGCGCVGALLLWWGSISRGPLFLHVCFSGANLIWVLLSLPSFVLCSVFRSLSGFAFLGSWCCRSGVSAGVFVGVSLSVLRSFLCVVGSRCCLAFVLFFGCCWLPSLPDVVSLPPAVGPVWRPGPVCTLVPPSGYLVASVTAWLPCFTAGSVVVLCRPYFIFVSWQQRLLALCGVFITLSTMLHVL